MKRTLLSATACLVIAVMGAVLAPSASAAGGDLAGRWTSVDNDGSIQTLDVTGYGANVYAMAYEDESATGACGGAPARISGPGHVFGDEVVMVGSLVCLPGGNVFRTRVEIVFVHDTETDTLTDSFGIVWQRAA
jgi:hypothetical protein